MMDGGDAGGEGRVRNYAELTVYGIAGIEF